MFPPLSNCLTYLVSLTAQISVNRTFSVCPSRLFTQLALSLPKSGKCRPSQQKYVSSFYETSAYRLYNDWKQVPAYRTLTVNSSDLDIVDQ